MLHDRIRKDCAIPRKIAFRDFFKAGTLRDRYFSVNFDILLLFRKGFVNYNVKFR
jgi:hypothetical protein